MTFVQKKPLWFFYLLPGFMQSCRSKLRFVFDVRNTWDWDAPIWFVSSASDVDGNTLAVDVAIMRNYMLFGFPLSTEKAEKRKVHATFNFRRQDANRYASFFVTVKEAGWKKPVSFHLCINAETNELEIIEFDICDRARFLQVMELILKAER